MVIGTDSQSLQRAIGKGRPPSTRGLRRLWERNQHSYPFIYFLQVGLDKSRSIARVVCPGGLGTGFLTRDNLLVTNHHVISRPEDARSANPVQQRIKVGGIMLPIRGSMMLS